MGPPNEGPANGNRNGQGEAPPRLEALGVLVALGVVLFVVFFGALIVRGLSALAGSQGLGGLETVLRVVADVGLVAALVLALALLAGVLGWFVVTVGRIAVRLARGRG